MKFTVVYRGEFYVEVEAADEREAVRKAEGMTTWKRWYGPPASDGMHLSLMDVLPHEDLEGVLLGECTDKELEARVQEELEGKLERLLGAVERLFRRDFDSVSIFSLKEVLSKEFGRIVDWP